MKIKDLPQEIKELVLKRQVEQGNEPNEELYLFNGKQIDNGNFKPFYERYSQNVDTSEQNVDASKDDFAIGFAEWLSKKERTKFQVLSDCKKTIIWFTSKNGIGATTSELLEIYKKEKGL